MTALHVDQQLSRRILTQCQSLEVACVLSMSHTYPGVAVLTMHPHEKDAPGNITSAAVEQEQEDPTAVWLRKELLKLPVADLYPHLVEEFLLLVILRKWKPDFPNGAWSKLMRQCKR